MENKQLQIAKDTIAKKYGYECFEKIPYNHISSINVRYENYQDIVNEVSLEYHRLMSEWYLVKDGLPDENKTVWLYNEKNKYVALGCSVYVNNEGWFLAVSNGEIYSENGEIVTEAEIDDYEFTHWKYVDKLPQPPK